LYHVNRNTPAVFTSEQPKPNNQALENELKETSIAIEHVTLEHGKGQSPEGQELSSHQIDTGCQDEQVRELGETIPSSAATSTCEGRHATVTIEYVDKCLACLSKLEQPVKSLPGIGPKTEQALNKLGLFTLRDLMWYFPRSFIDRSVLQRDIRDVADGDLGTFILTIHKDKVTHNAVPCSDEEGNPLNIVFFYGNSRQSTNIVNAEKAKLCKSSVDTMIVSGKVSKHPEKGYTIFNPDVIATVDEAKDVLGIEPVYGVCSGLSQNKLIKAIEGALEVAQELRLLPESLPQVVLDDLNWPTFVDAISIAHKPNTMDDAGVDSPARHRIAFEELCIQQAQLALTRWDLKYSGLDSNINSQKITYESSTWQDSPLVSRAVRSLPFELTRSQTDCLNELWSDAISSNGRMTRLLQGDVGSGKTVLAYLLGLGCIESCQGGGSVVAILAPTQLLALQHFQTLKGFTESYNDKYPDATIKLSVELLTGSIVGSKRNDIYTRLEEADAIFVIGTHALVSSDVIDRLRNLRSSGESKGLALAVVDEEQRFGVQQRRALSSCAANTMFMSATPIPRTVGLSKGSGLLDVTNLESENVRNVETTITTKDNLDKVIGALRTKISRGSKCFWVLPRIGNETDSEDSNCGKSSVLSRYTMLTDILGQDKVGYVHGRMSIKDREEQLARFADASSSVKLLVSTTVIEVGIDIPNVDILIVENADRFGLSGMCGTKHLFDAVLLLIC
jgi:ATP-dependent DNA helicase RecG